MESAHLQDFDLAHLPMLSKDSRDKMDEVVFVGKAVMKEQYVRV